jgi:hypothetical protein
VWYVFYEMYISKWKTDLNGVFVASFPWNTNGGRFVSVFTLVDGWMDAKGFETQKELAPVLQFHESTVPSSKSLPVASRLKLGAA